jgi:hypothetical protein
MSAETPSIYAAFSAAMEEVQAVRKEGFNDSQRYNFRGIDQVVNVVGPIFRKHKIIPIPHHCAATYRDVMTSTGKPTREVTTSCTYRFYGPAGDYLEAIVPGESLDSGDKGTAKAMSVAYRILLLQSLIIPTDDRDPDADSYERAHELPPVDPAVLELNEAKQAVADAWEAVFGPFDKEAAANHYRAYSMGESELATATAAQLNAYAQDIRDAAAAEG